MTNDLHYVREDQSEAHDVLLCVGTGNNLDTPNRMKFETHEFYVKSAAQMAALFPDQLDAIREHPPDRRDDRPRRCRSASCASRTSRSRTATPSRAGCAPSASAASSAATARSRRSSRQRLDYELGVILSMGYAGYFLIVADFIRVRPRAGHPDDLPGERAGLDRDLHARASRRSTRSSTSSRSSASSTRTA